MICDAPVAIHSPGYEAEIRTALGIVSAATGVRFTESPTGVLDFRLGDVPANAWYTGDAIIVQPAAYSTRYLTYLYVHELGHWLGMDHNHYRHSVMNTAGWPKRPAFTPRDLTEARALTADCR